MHIPPVVKKILMAALAIFVVLVIEKKTQIFSKIFSKIPLVKKGLE